MLPICVGVSKQSDGPHETHSSESGSSPDPIRAFLEAPLFKITHNSQRREVWLFISQNNNYKKPLSEQMKPSATEVKLKTKTLAKELLQCPTISQSKGKSDGTQDRGQSQTI